MTGGPSQDATPPAALTGGTVSAAEALELARRDIARGDDVRALWTLERILQQSGGRVCGEAHHLLALLLALNAQWDRAAAACRQAWEHGFREPGHEWLRRYLDHCGERPGLGIHPDDVMFFDLCRGAFGVSWDDPGCHVLLARIYRERRLDAAALGCCGTALALDPAMPAAHLLSSLIRLRAGDVAAGWQDFYQWMKSSEYPDRLAYMRLRDRGMEWAGGPVDHLLLLRLFGNGDVFQFIRYLGAVSRRARKITLALPPGVRTLIEDCLERLDLDPACAVAFVDHVQYCQGPVDAVFCVDFLPWLLMEAHGVQPTAPGYLRPGPMAPARGGLTLDPGAGWKIGVCWATGDALSDRTVPAETFAFLAGVPGAATIVSLQQPPRPDDFARLAAACPQATVIDPGAAVWSFDALAALIRQLDLVATIDTGVAHLAAAQGIPTWVLLRYAADWRFFDDETTSRWYPSMRLFRQERPGDVASAARAMAAAWTSMVERGRESR